MCKLARMPKSRSEFWEPKFEATVARDSRNAATLEAAGWRVLAIWECELAQVGILDALISAVRAEPVRAKKDY